MSILACKTVNSPITLGATWLLSRFEGMLFSATKVVAVAAVKPAPDLFLLAALKCSVKPSRCLVIEDTAVGVSAALAAGMTVFGYSEITPAKKLHEAGAHIVFSRMSELPLLIQHFSPA